ncbi:hypothetical protein MA16_Dca018068 [Dendrobium catenatum]|uniref:RNA polymerase Rpb4/RPC9 core domain-containing protein n=2 Tax=Dendrobium TaxID=37818 RepID=A0A2I0XHZ4_9ASPA|nr:hypothetical protein MA16_Dca018068 [Dendrobium catenatum]
MRCGVVATRPGSRSCEIVDRVIKSCLASFDVDSFFLYLLDRKSGFLRRRRELAHCDGLESSATMSADEDENAAELKIGEEFLKAKCLMNCEVALILDRRLEQLQQMSDDPTNQMSQVFEKSHQYVKRFSRYKNQDAVKQVREILSRNKLAEFELCVLGNLCPETVEEAIAMVPSLKSKGRALEDDAIEKMLNDLSLIKKFE